MDATANDLMQLRDERKQAQAVKDSFMARQSNQYHHKERIQRTDKVARGDFHLVFPNGQMVGPEKPKAPNIVQLALDDRASGATAARPTLRCEPVNERSRPRAERRERIASSYWRDNNADALRPFYQMDLDVAGITYKLVLPNFDRRAPQIRRLDPRFAWPDHFPTPDNPVRNLIYSYQEAIGLLQQEHPEADWATTIGRRPHELVEVIEYYDSTDLIRLALTRAADGSTNAVHLVAAPNLLGRPPLAVGMRPSHDSEPRGIFDQAISVLHAHNIAVNLIIDASTEWLTSPLVYHDIDNIEDYGFKPLRAATDRGFARRMAPDGANPQFFALLQEQKDNARIASVYPQGRQGMADQSIISAAGVNALQGSYSSSLAFAQKVEATAWEDCLSLCFATDETYFADERKWIAGSVNARQFSESYVPGADIKGDHRITVEYGGAAGMDELSFEVRVSAQYGNGLLSRRRAKELLPTIQDVVQDEKQQIREKVLDAGLSFIQAKAANPDMPDFAPAARLIEALDEDDETVYTVLAGFGEIATGQPAAPAAGNNPLEQFTQAASLARGGSITPNPSTNIPGVGALPPLSQILAQPSGTNTRILSSS